MGSGVISKLKTEEKGLKVYTSPVESVCPTCKGSGSTARELIPIEGVPDGFKFHKQTQCTAVFSKPWFVFDIQINYLYRTVKLPYKIGHKEKDAEVYAIEVIKQNLCLECCIHKTDWNASPCSNTNCDDGCPLTEEEISNAPKCKDCKGKDKYYFQCDWRKV
jgi:hypothetical protein